ncbi:MAG: HEPN domain-containing protein [bacterium]|nr:HEPN domain-containing protein [bacterium]
MNEETVKNWMRKADNDLLTGQHELERESPITDTVCFHMQQCAEKYLKSFLIFHGQEVPRTHSLAALIERCAQVDPEFYHLEEMEVDHLTDYAVTVRYGDDFYMPSIEEARRAMYLAEQVRTFVRAKLAQSGLVE